MVKILAVTAACVVGCAKKVPESRYRQDLAGQQARYELQIRELVRGGERARAEQRRRDAEVVRVESELRRRIDALEQALADKERLLERPEGAEAPSRPPRDAALKTARIALEAAGAKLWTHGEGVRIRIPADRLFERASTRLAIGSEGIIEAVAGFLRVMSAHRGDIQVHSDSLRPEDAEAPDTWRLTQRQGLVLLQALLDHGADPSRIVVSAFGEYHPINTNDGLEGRALNRRVEIDFVPLLRHSNGGESVKGQ